MANKRIEVLEKLLALKEETIKELERQVQLLKNQPPVVIPPIPQVQPYNPNPWIQPYSPQYPFGGPYIITSGDTVNVPIKSGNITYDVNSTYTLTNSDGTSTTYTANDIPHC